MRRRALVIRGPGSKLFSTYCKCLCIRLESGFTNIIIEFVYGLVSSLEDGKKQLSADFHDFTIRMAASRLPGRPSISIIRDQLVYFCDLGFTRMEMAKIFDVSLHVWQI